VARYAACWACVLDRLGYWHKHKGDCEVDKATPIPVGTEVKIAIWSQKPSNWNTHMVEMAENGGCHFIESISSIKKDGYIYRLENCQWVWRRVDLITSLLPTRDPNRVFKELRRR